MTLDYAERIAWWNAEAQWHLDRVAYCNTRMHELRAQWDVELAENAPDPFRLDKHPPPVEP